MTHKQKESLKQTIHTATTNHFPFSFFLSFLIASACSFSSERTELPTRRFSHSLAAWAAVEAARCLCDEASQTQAAGAAASISSRAWQRKAAEAAACFAATAWAAKPAVVCAEAELAKRTRRADRRGLAS